MQIQAALMGQFVINRTTWPWLAVASLLATSADAQSALSTSSNLLWQRSSSSSTSQSAIEQVASVTRPANFQVAETSPNRQAPVEQLPPKLSQPPAYGSGIDIGSTMTEQPIPMDWVQPEEYSHEQHGCDSCGELECGCQPFGYLLDWSRCDLLIGATSFTSASNFITSGSQSAGKIEGSFGFQGGFNFGSRVPGLLAGQVGSQIGVRAITAQLQGSSAGEDSRNQLFLTAGLFRRVDYGLQGGMVVDYLHDNGLLSVDLLQLRGELSFLMTPCHEAGFRFTSSQRTAHSTTHVLDVTGPVTARLTALDTYRFFYRCRFGDQGKGLADVFGGFSEDRDGLVGLSLSAPLQGSVGLISNITYVVPRQNAQPAFTSEAWNMGIAMVWTPGRRFGSARDYYRPLFEVADNGSLIGKK